MVAAIQSQFDLVLRRPASEAEAARYLDLTQTAIQLAGNAEGVRQMLKAVLLESDFLYRTEFGSSEPDPYGRRMLTGHEGAMAIAYALGDLGRYRLQEPLEYEETLVSKATDK